MPAPSMSVPMPSSQFKITAADQSSEDELEEAILNPGTDNRPKPASKAFAALNQYQSSSDSEEEEAAPVEVPQLPTS